MYYDIGITVTQSSPGMTACFRQTLYHNHIRCKEIRENHQTRSRGGLLLRDKDALKEDYLSVSDGNKTTSSVRV